MPAFEERRLGNVRWVHATSADKKTLTALKKKYPFLREDDLRECEPPPMRPKLVPRREYIFLVLLYPVFDRVTRTISASEVDIFIAKNFILTVHNGELPAFTTLHAKKRAHYDEASIMVHNLLETLLLGIFPMLNHISQDIDHVQERVLRHTGKTATIEEILRIKTNVVATRKSMQNHKMLIRKLLEEAPRFMDTQQIEDYLEVLIDESKEIWDHLESYKDTIDALHEAYASLMEHRTNTIMKTLTIIAVLTFPLSLITATFGTRVGGMPLEDNPDGYAILVYSLILGALLMIATFRWKRWL